MSALNGRSAMYSSLPTVFCGEPSAASVLHTVALYPRAASFKTADAAVTFEFDGTVASLNKVSSEAALSLELKLLAPHAKEVVSELLTALKTDFEGFYLRTVDCIIIRQHGQVVLRAVNPAGASGRALLLDAHFFHQAMREHTQAFKWRLGRVVFAAALAVVVMAGWHAESTRRSQLAKLDELTAKLTRMAISNASGAAKEQQLS